jgi:hypothetical protein
VRSDEVVRRLRAWKEGKPLPRYQTIHTHIAHPKDAMVLSFVRMGGESSPWGLSLGHPGAKPTIVSVPEPRNRDLVADMVAKVAPILVRHFRAPDATSILPGGPSDLTPLRQLWVPNRTHLDMLHFLAYAYTFTKWGDPTRAIHLNALGRLCGWLFREAQRPGQMTVLVATDVLRSAFTFPSDDLRQAHLGFLLAWLETRGGRDTRLRAALEVEQQSVATSLDPSLERDELDALVQQWNESRDLNPGRMQRKAAEISRVIAPELERRHALVERAMKVIEKDKRQPNKGLDSLVTECAREAWYQYMRTECRIADGEAESNDGPAYIPSPETDRYPAAAASRYFVQEASAEHAWSALVHYDEELQEEVIAAGDGIRGTIVDVRDEGVGRATVPVWVIQTTDRYPLRVREGSRLCVAGLQARSVEIRSIERHGSDALRIEVEVTGRKTARSGDTHAADVALIGEEVVLLPASADAISRKKMQRVWARDIPGGWLTHAYPGGPRGDLPEEIADQAGAGGLLPVASN